MTDTASTPPSPLSLRLRVLDTVFRLEPKSAHTHAMLRRDWSRCVVTGDDVAADRPFDLPEDEPLPEHFGSMCATRLTVAAIEALAGRRLMFHAAGLADGAGRVVALVGPSGAGKTTATHALAAAGLGYVTDETVAVDDDGVVLPYPKPLSILGDQSGHKSQHGPDQLGLPGIPERLALARLVLLDRVRDVVEPTLADVPMMDAVLELIPQTSALPSLEVPLQRLCRLVERCGVRRLTYAEAATLVPVVRALLARAVPIGADWEPLPIAPPVGPSTFTQPGAFTQATPRDAVRIGDEGLLLLDRTPVRLGPLALTLWERCGSRATQEELVEAALQAHGPHPEAGTIVRQALAELVAAGAVLANP